MSRNYEISTVFSVTDRATSVLNRMNSSGNKFSKAFNVSMKKAETRVAALGSALTTVAAGAATAIVSAAGIALRKTIPAAMELEQNIGGTEAVFGTYAISIQTSADKAFKEMGLSASDYMATANKMGSLLQGAGLSIEKTMELTTKAMQRAADVASVMGLDTTSAMESIAAAAKGNFTMMDNLGVAMNATTLNAYALEKKINFKWNTATNAQKTELAMQMFFDRTEKYAGNFAREAQTTLSGSFASMKTNAENIIAKLALGKSIDIPMQNLHNSVITFTKNIVPAVVQIINQLPELIAGVLSEIEPIIKAAMANIRSPFGEILVGILKIVETLWKMRLPILIIGGLVGVFHILMDAIYATKAAVTGFKTVMGILSAARAIYNTIINGTIISLIRERALYAATTIQIKAYTIASKVAAAAQWLLNAAMAANPVVLITAGIVALIGIIIVLTGKWQAMASAVDGFFAKIRNMKGIGGAILQTLVAPLELVWNAIRGIFDTINAFKVGGFIAGIKMLGLSILQMIAAPIQAILEAVSWIPGLGWLHDKISGFFENARNSILAGSGASDSAAGGLPAESEADAATSMAEPTKSAAVANSYSREESITTNRVEIGLSDGLTVKNGATAAPAFTLQTGRR